MLYYYYGKEPESEGVLRANEMSGESASIQKYGELIIEDDTIYEIDETCLNCRKGEKKFHGN
jgi:hypothetical protein